MARKKLSEFRAKTLLYGALGQNYDGLEVDAETEDWQKSVGSLDDSQHYVVKVDQAEKGRFKKGLVKLDRSKEEVINDITELASQGYRFVLVEPYRQHDQSDEWYFSAELTRDGTQLAFSKAGGVDVEGQAGQMVHATYSDTIEGVEIPQESLDALMKVFEDNYFSFLEINPLIVKDGKLTLLDAAVEADNEATFFEEGWDESDLRQPRTHLTPEEETVHELAAKSQASFSLEVINPDGGIFLLLSGGGASVVVADEVFNLGYGKQLANYGEYSGNPNFEETRIYTEQIIQLLLKSQASQKVLVIGGGVANFTDVRVTFKGVVAALQAYEDKLQQQNVKIFVRRGGPHEKEGLADMKSYLEKTGLYGHVSGPELMLADIVGLAIKEGGVNA